VVVRNRHATPLPHVLREFTQTKTKYKPGLSRLLLALLMLCEHRCI
jgi:hypothetical protein